MSVDEWTLCTEHEIIVRGGSCPHCNGDRNLIQVCPSDQLDEAVLAEREACAVLVDAFAEKAGMVRDGKALAASIRTRGE